MDRNYRRRMGLGLIYELDRTDKLNYATHTYYQALYCTLGAETFSRRIMDVCGLRYAMHSQGT